MNSNKFLFLFSVYCLYAALANSQIITTVAGTGGVGFGGDGGPATLAQVTLINGIDRDAAGNIYFTDYNNHRVRKVDVAGTITTIAGMTASGYAGDGGPATGAMLGVPWGVACDASGNVYITDPSTTCNCIRKVDGSGVISTIAGGIGAGFTGDGGPASAARLNMPKGITADGAGNIYFVDQSNNRVRKIDASGIISTVAGNGSSGCSGDGFPATSAALRPDDVAVDATGNLYILTFGAGCNVIRKVDVAGIITTVAGTGAAGFSGDGGPATAATISPNTGISVDVLGNIYFGDNANHFRKISTSGIITTVAGVGTVGFTGDGCAATAAQLNSSADAVVDATGTIYFSDKLNHRIRKIHNGSIPTFAGGASQHLNICAGSFADLDTMMSVLDGDMGQGISWSAITSPMHGTLTAAYSTSTSGGMLLPAGLSYNPTIGYTGPDTFSVLVSDCGNMSDTTTVFVFVDSAVFSGTIVGSDSICPGDTVTLTSSVPGGSWVSSNSSVVSINAAGKITGVGTGVATITYEIVNGCGTGQATHVVNVRSTTDCHTSVAEYQRGVFDGVILVWPNPYTAGWLKINVPGKADEEMLVRIYNSQGKRVMEYAATANETKMIQLSEPAGTYMILAENGGGVLKSKLQVIR